MKPLIYLEIRQFVNSIKNSVKSPKRLIPMLLMGGYIISSLISGLFIMARNGGAHSPDVQMMSKIPTELIESGIFLFLCISCISVMYGAFNSGLMIFSVAHIDFLFPTPIERKHVLLIKLIKDYLKYTFWIAFFVLFFGSSIFSAVGLPFLPWGIISIASLVALFIFVINIAHTINIVFTFSYEKFRQLGMAIKTILIAAPILAILIALAKYTTTGNAYASVLWAAKSPVISVIFAPIKWCSKLLLAPLYEVTYPDEWIHFGILWLLAIGSTILLLSRRENVYEPSIGISVKIAKRKQAIRTGDYTSVKIDAMREKGTMRLNGVSIPPFGMGAPAFVWKSLLMRYRMSHWKLISMILLPIVIVYVLKIYTNNGHASFLRFLPLILTYMVWILSMTAQVEMRTEFKHSNIVKSMPIAAWKIMLAQTIGTVVNLTLGMLAFAILMWFLLPQSRTWILGASTIIAPFLGFAVVPAMIIPSIMYPDTRDILQNYISGMFSCLLVSIAVAPTVVLGVLLFFVFPNAKVLFVTAVCLSNIIMGVAGITLAGAVFRRYDPTSE